MFRCFKLVKWNESTVNVRCYIVYHKSLSLRLPQSGILISGTSARTWTLCGWIYARMLCWTRSKVTNQSTESAWLEMDGSLRSDLYAILQAIDGNWNVLPLRAIICSNTLLIWWRMNMLKFIMDDGAECHQIDDESTSEHGAEKTEKEVKSGAVLAKAAPVT